MKYCIHVIVLGLIGFFCSTPLMGQQAITGISNPTLSFRQLASLVVKYHPISKQAGIQIGQAQADLRISRGAFDPQFSYKIAEKTFDGTSYYEYQQPSLTIPTWFGITVQTGVEQLNGNRIDPTETLGQSSYLGIQIPLGRDLLTDKRRTDLQKAKIAKEASYAERRKMLNDLLLEAYSAYWEWWQQTRILSITGAALEVAKRRVDFVKIGVRLGDRPAIDTIEALTQVQNFELQYNQAMIGLRNTQFYLSQFLWQENEAPYLLPENCQPAHEEWSKQ